MKEGVEAFVYVDYNHRTPKLAALAEDLCTEQQKKGFSSLPAVVTWAKERGVTVSLSNVQWFFKKNFGLFSRLLNIISPHTPRDDADSLGSLVGKSK